MQLHRRFELNCHKHPMCPWELHSLTIQMLVRVALLTLSPCGIDRVGGATHILCINQAVHFSRNAALALLATGIVLLPASNAKLPLSTQQAVTVLLVSAFAWWAAARVLDWRPPQPHERRVWWLAAIIELAGWTLTAFPQSMVERSTGVLLELDKEWWRSFGSIDQTASIQSMTSISVALLALVMTADFAAERRGRQGLAIAMTVAGGAAAIVGLCWRNPVDLRSIWHVPHVPSSVFGWFWYHGNAATFLNLTWPATLWLCLILVRNGVRRPFQQVVLAFLAAALLTQIVAVFVNVSKMGHVMLILESGWMVAAGLMIWRPRVVDLLFNFRRMMVFAVIGGGLLLVGAWLGGAADGVIRWNVFAERQFDDPARRHAAMMALQIGIDHGWMGAGPGTFEWVSVHYSSLDPVLAGGRWRHAHNDYAQLFAEWGWLGAVLFALALAFPGRSLTKGMLLVLSRESRRLFSFSRRSALVCFSAAFIAFLTHAAVDFPLQIDATRHLFAVLTGMLLAMSGSPSVGGTRRRSR